MSNERVCPECGTKLAPDERFCPDCGAEVPVTETPETGKDTPVIGDGARANIMGSVSSTSNRQTNISTSKVDNSSTVHNNTTIVMGKEKAEYCEVCGNPFGEKHARCPKCGKQICFDCRVPGKNRCIECEKKALNEYRLAFQQLFVTTGGDIGVSGRQMMDQKARELDVEKEKKGIEEEISGAFRPAAKAVQPGPVQARPQQQTASTGTFSPAGSKGIGSLTGGSPATPPSSKGPEKGKSKAWVWIVIAAVAAAAVFFAVSGNGDKTESPAPVSTEKTLAVPQDQESQKEEKARTQPEAKPAGTAPAASPAKSGQAAKPAPAAKTDVNYEKGMEAYNSGNGLEALDYFKASGSADAHYMIGVIYENGCGSVGANAMMARKSFKKAADMGSKKAEAKL